MAKNNEKFVSRENAKTLWGYMVDLLTGKYTKPSGGIPKSDLESSVQTSLGLADSALQSETDPTVPSWAKQPNKPSYTQDEVPDGTTYKRVSSTEKDTWNAKGTYSKPSGGIPKSDLASAVQTSLGLADSALQGETDPTVPTWAKQSSKPSYTQDEVSDGSTYKRVTQTEKDAWSGKQNALTTTQMQAVNSGIDSSKVGKIADNTSSIALLESMNGAKNLWDFANAQLNTAAGDYTKTDESVTVSANNAGWKYVSFAVPIKAGEYVFSFKVRNFSTSVAGNTNLTITSDSAGQTTIRRIWITENGTYSGRFVIPSDTIIYVFYFASIGTAITSSFTAYDNMIIAGDAYDAGFTDYVPYALPNYDLTKLQAEDRNALVEVVDKGAKNELRILSDGVYQLDTITLTVANGIITCSGTASTSNQWFDININHHLSGNYIFSGCPAAPSGKATMYCEYTDDWVWFGLIDNSEVGVEVNFDPSRTLIIRCQIYANTDPNGLVFKPMLCRKAYWKISPKFVPYRKSLDQLEATKAPVLSGSITSGDLNDVTINTFAMYANTVSSLPTSENYYVETSVFDANSLLQRAYNIATAESYVRVKCVGTWSAWKQITNA